MRFFKGTNRDYAPTSPIKLLSRLIARFEILIRFSKGDNRDYAPMFPS